MTEKFPENTPETDIKFKTKDSIDTTKYFIYFIFCGGITISWLLLIEENKEAREFFSNIYLGSMIAFSIAMLSVGFKKDVTKLRKKISKK